MEVKPGYEQTEIGVIPEDWKVMPFIEAVGSYIDYRGRTPRKLGLSWGGGDILALSANNVQMGRIDPDKEAYFGSEELYRKWMIQGECEAGDVLLTMEAPLGNVAQIPDSKRYILSQRVLLIKPRNWLHRDFLTHYMKGFVFQKQLSLNSTGSTAKGIQRRTLDDILIGLPPTRAEQEAIAEALGDADAFIESLERLVAKKRQLKQGAMQELLTGKKRLPGFTVMPGCKRTAVGMIPEDWDVVSLRALLKQGPTNGWSGRCVEGTVGTPTLSLAATTSGRLVLNSETVKWLEHRVPRWSDLYLAPGDILVQRSNTAELVGTTALFDGPPGEFVYPDLMMRLRFRQPATAHWFWRYANSASGRSYFRSAAAGSTGTMPKVSGENLREMPVPLPTRAEQEAIAEILSNMDAEITALEAKLAKARQLKQGLMQELLTGRIRLV